MKLKHIITEATGHKVNFLIPNGWITDVPDDSRGIETVLHFDPDQVELWKKVKQLINNAGDLTVRTRISELDPFNDAINDSMKDGTLPEDEVKLFTRDLIYQMEKAVKKDSRDKKTASKLVDRIKRNNYLPIILIQLFVYLNKD